MDMVSLEWPPNSPDLNPIEHIWYLLKVIQNIRHRPTTALKLAKAIKKTWEELNENVFNKLVESMPSRIAAVINAKGGNTKY